MMQVTYKNKIFDPRDEWSFKTHFIGILFGIAATLYMWTDRMGQGAGTVASFVIFGLSIIALYTCSSVYHYNNGSDETIFRLRKLDHSMIYVLIAGSYTPILYNCVEQPKGTIFLAAIWLVAAAGVLIKVFWFNAPRWLYTSMYILMGWAIVIDPKALMTLDPRCLGFLIAGGLSYTIGAVFYILKKPNISDKFGFHELFHCFILLGTVFQFISIAVFV
ncbi:MAG: hemolysin III family protein [Anaerovoracaceae bacterium]|nr:hemolysin III family protein [Anaerovoracaceae bacterium]